MADSHWIRANINQRKCVVFCKLNDEHPSACKCYRPKTIHPNHHFVCTETWSQAKNTETEPCVDFGSIHFGYDKSSKFIRIDVETDTSTSEHLLFEEWNLPKPTWILSVMGDVHNVKGAATEGDRQGQGQGLNLKEEELELQLQSALESFSDGQNIWVTSEGINFGVSKIVGRALERCRDLSNVTPVGIFAWGACDDIAHSALTTDKCLARDEEGNIPSVLYPYHLLVDDGTENPSSVHQSFQKFRMGLEKSLANHTNLSTSVPLVILLYGGWSYVIDGVKTAIENNIPIVVLKGTGGFADILANVFEASKEDTVAVITKDSGHHWTGTVIDDFLRKEVETEFLKIHGDTYTAGQHAILQCLQKRELLTVVDMDREENTLTNAIIKALLKSKSLLEVLRMLDYYMPARLFEEEGAAAAALNGMKQTALSKTAGLFLLQAMLLDQAECVQHIIDYQGVDLVDFAKTISALLSWEETTDMFPSHKLDTAEIPDDVYQVLLKWAVQTKCHNCAAVFWKKGKHLLATSLVASVVLRRMKNHEHNIGDKKTLEDQAVLFDDRAIGLIKECYDNNREKAMALIQAQSLANVWGLKLLGCCLAGNQKIFATEAFKEYIDWVWYGRINPTHQRAYKKPTAANFNAKDTEKETPVHKIRRIILSPIVTYSFNLVSYIVFLCIYGHFLLFHLRPKYSLWEGVLVVWWVAFVWEECSMVAISDQSKCCGKDISCLRSFCGRVKIYFLKYQNILVFASLLFFLIGGVLMTVVHLDNTRTGVYEAARVFLSVDIMLFTWRILLYLPVFSTMGPLLEMIFQMVIDIIPFLVIMFIFVISQGLAVHSLLYSNVDWSPEELLNIPKHAFWNVFGEVGLDVTEAPAECYPPLSNTTATECPTRLGQYTVPFLLGMYMLLMNVLLLNLLIAKFSYTFGKVHDQTEWLAAWQKARVILDYYGKPPLPPPFNILFDIPYYLYTLGSRNRKPTSEHFQLDEDEEMASWERSMAEYYLASAEFTSSSERMTMQRTAGTADEHVRSVDHHTVAGLEQQLASLTDLIGRLDHRMDTFEYSLNKTLTEQIKIRRILK